MAGPYIYRPARERAERRWRRSRRLVVVLGALWVAAAWVGGAGPVSADTVQGYGTNGACIGAGNAPLTLWSQSAVGVKSIAITFRMELHTSGVQVTVAQGGWTLSTGATWETAYWQNTNVGGGSSTVVYLVGTPIVVNGVDMAKGTAVGLEAGTSGTLRYQVIVRGYDPASCARISDVRVTRTYWGAGATPPPGGGGFTAPTPTPTTAAPTPTPPAAATPIPGATPGPGVVCFPNWAGVTECYPEPPTGWCYVSTPLGGGTTGALVECATSTTAPTPSPTPPPAEYGCITQAPGGGDLAPYAETHLVCQIKNPKNTSSASNINQYATGTGPAGRIIRIKVLTWTASGAGATLEFRQAGVYASSSKLSVFSNPVVGSTYCIKTNSASNNPAAPPAGCTQTTSASYDTESLWIGCSFSAFDSEVCVLQVSVFADNAAFTGGGGLPGPTPTPPHTPSPAPTIPPDYWGGGTPPPGVQVDVDVDVDICDDDPTILACWKSFPPIGGGVDICAEHPGIAACATAAPMPTFGPEGPESTWFGAQVDGLASGLRGKAPFGYIDQVAEAVTTAIDGAEGAPVDFSFTMPWWSPAEAGGTRNVELEIPFADFAAALAPHRWVFLALLMFAAARVLLGIALRAVGSGREKGGGDDAG